VAAVSYAGVIALLLIVRGRHNDISHRLYPGTLHFNMLAAEQQLQTL